MAPVLEADHLKKSYGALVAVEDVSFTVGPGEVIGLLGPNGAGKSTTVGMIAGLLQPDAGEVRLNGRALTGDTDPAKTTIGLVPQDLALFEELPARENLRFFGALYGLAGAPLDAAITSGLEFVGLAERAQHKVKTFSGGMKRRLNLAAGLLHDPQLVLLDEPTVGSSRMSRSGSCRSAAARLSRRFMPPEYVLTLSPARSESPTSASASRAARSSAAGARS